MPLRPVRYHRDRPCLVSPWPVRPRRMPFRHEDLEVRGRSPRLSEGVAALPQGERFRDTWDT